MSKCKVVVMNKYKAVKMDKKGELYVEYDSEIEAFGVFGTESGFCYASFTSKKEADAYLIRDAK